MTSSQVTLGWTSGGGTTAGFKVYRNGAQLAATSTAAYVDTTVAPASAYAYSVAAVDAGSNLSPQTASLAVSTPSPTPVFTGAASFVKDDPTTSGTWKGAYGGEGAIVMADAATVPSYVAVTPSNNGTFTWVASTSDPRAPQKIASATDRIAACWFAAGTFSIDLQFNDKNTHQTALYLFDFDTYSGGRAERIDVLDSSNNLLDSRTTGSFSGGRYLVWNLSGHIVLRITNTKSVGNAVLSALLFGPGAPASVTPTPVPAPTKLTATSVTTGQVTLAWTSGGGSTSGFNDLP